MSTLFQENVTNAQVETAAKNLLNTFNEIRQECIIKPVHSGPIYVVEASELCSIGANSSDVNQMLTLQINKDKSEKMENLEKIMQMGILIAIICAIPVGAYVIVNAVG